ncbi:MAG: WecB/TagA/CpsF family glycosyltransferase [Pricia sp.]
MKEYPHSICMGYPIFTGSLKDLSIDKKLIVNTINQYSYCIAEEDDDFQKALKESDVLLPDGVGIVKASSFLNNENIQKIAGADLHTFLLKELQKNGGSCFYMGSSEKTLAKIEKRIAREYPNIRVGTYSPPFKPELSETDNLEIRRAVNSFRADVLFVGMTAPKQEKWISSQKDFLDANVICAIGAVFDFYAGTVDRPSKFWIESNKEWMGRLIKEPRRMWKRYVLYGAFFGYYLLKEKFKGQNRTNGSNVKVNA